MVIETKLVKLLKVRGITLWPFVFVVDREDWELINHEKIHLRQQIEMLVIPFYMSYLYFYIKNRLKGYNHRMAYKRIPFELEANYNECVAEYLKDRHLFAWLNYLK